MTKKIEKSIFLNATEQRVWDILTKDELNQEWYAVFQEGTKASTDWEEGSSVKFYDPSGSGIFGKIAVSKPPHALSMYYEGIVSKGKEDYFSEEAKEMQGLYETYVINRQDQQTQLQVSLDIPEKYYEYMNEAWEKAIVKLKEIAERI